MYNIVLHILQEKKLLKVDNETLLEDRDEIFFRAPSMVSLNL
jgi:hypothetical protein